MVWDDLNRVLAERSFEYGPTTVEVTVSIVKKSYTSPNYGGGYSPYHRRVTAEAVSGEYANDNNKVKNQTNCEIVIEECIPREVNLVSLREEILYTVVPLKSVDALRDERREAYDGRMVSTGPVVSVTKQVEETVQPVLEQLDLHYNLTGVDIDVDIDVTMEYLECETSLAEVDEEIASFTGQLERSSAGGITGD